MQNPLRFRPYQPSSQDISYRDKLPHRSRAGKTIFITFRLSDSLSAYAEVDSTVSKAQMRWLRRRDLNIDPLTQDVGHQLSQKDIRLALEYRLISFHVRERFLEKNLGSCVLQLPDAIDAVRTAILEEQNWGSKLGSFVNCYNHVHILLIPPDSGQIRDPVQRIKGRASCYLGRREISKLPKPVWQRSWEGLIRPVRAVNGASYDFASIQRLIYSVLRCR
jgi:REP element-mobilizing transposase RayT